MLFRSPNVKVFWDTLKGALPYIQQMVTSFNGAGPSLAKLLVQFAKFLALVTQSSAIKIFFDVLIIAMEGLNALLSNKLVRSFLGFLAVIHGVTLAFQSIAFVARYALLYIIGAFEKLSLAVSLFRNLFVTSFNFIYALIVANPIGALVVAIVAVIAALVLLFKHNKAFHDLVMKVWGAIKDFIGAAVDAIVGFFKKIPEYLSTLWDNLVSAAKIAWDGQIGRAHV